MEIALWIAQGLLGTAILMAALMKLIQPKEKLAKMAWTQRYSASMIKFIGVSEILISLGLILPQLTGILPILTPLAALSLCVVMVLAAVEHLRDKETKETLVNLIILGLSAFVAACRF